MTYIIVAIIASIMVGLSCAKIVGQAGGPAWARWLAFMVAALVVFFGCLPWSVS
jgi:hypothetical protein